MKKFLCLGVLLCATAVLFSGCIKVEDTLIINKNESAQYKVAMLFDKRLEPYMGSQMDEAIKNAEKEQKDKIKVKAEKVTRGDYFGYEITKDVDSILDLSLEDLSNDSAQIKSYNKDKNYVSVVEKNIFKKVYRINADIDLTRMKNEAAFSSLDKETASMFKYDTHIKLPVKAKSNNATSVDEKTNTYTWSVKFFQSNPIKLEWVIYNEVSIGITVLLLLAAIIGLVKLVGKKAKKI